MGVTNPGRFSPLLPSSTEHVGEPLGMDPQYHLASAWAFHSSNIIETEIAGKNKSMAIVKHQGCNPEKCLWG